MRFAPEYVQYVLNENFNDAKKLFLGAADVDPLRAPGDARRAAVSSGPTTRMRFGLRSTRSPSPTSAAPFTTADRKICSFTSTG